MDLNTAFSSFSIGAVIGFGLKAYLGSYLTDKGKNLATKEDLQIFVNQVRESEKAKIAAQTQSIDQLIANTKALTATTETIKAKVTDETWNRQQQWIYRQQIYRDLLEATYSIAQTLISASSSEGPATQEAVDGARLLVSQVHKLHCLIAVAGICTGPAVNIVLRSLTNLEAKVGTNDLSLFSTAMADLVVAARMDLGYDPISLTPP